MHGPPKEYEAGLLSLIVAWEALLRGDAYPDRWRGFWRAECVELGLLEGQSLADRPPGAPDDIRSDYERVTVGLKRVIASLRQAYGVPPPA